MHTTCLQIPENPVVRVSFADCPPNINIVGQLMFYLMFYGLCAHTFPTPLYNNILAVSFFTENIYLPCKPQKDGVTDVSISRFPFADITGEFCSSESFDIACNLDEAILMQSALYGRMQPGRCISAEYDHSIGCYSDVLHYMDSQCSGRQKCKILIATLEAVAQPCQKDFKSYLQATYRCVKGRTNIV